MAGTQLAKPAKIQDRGEFYLNGIPKNKKDHHSAGVCGQVGGGRAAHLLRLGNPRSRDTSPYVTHELMGFSDTF